MVSILFQTSQNGLGKKCKVHVLKKRVQTIFILFNTSQKRARPKMRKGACFKGGVNNDFYFILELTIMG